MAVSLADWARQQGYKVTKSGSYYTITNPSTGKSTKAWEGVQYTGDNQLSHLGSPPSTSKTSGSTSSGSSYGVSVKNAGGWDAWDKMVAQDVASRTSGGSSSRNMTLREYGGNLINYNPATNTVSVGPYRFAPGSVPGTTFSGGTHYVSDPGVVNQLLDAARQALGTSTAPALGTPATARIAQLVAPLSPQTIDMQQIINMIGEQYRNVTYPYQQQLERLLANAPTGTPLSQEEILRRAQEYANLVYDPQVAAITRALEQQRQAAEAQRAAIEAAYASVPERTSRLMEEARQKALESAIARGGGRSGQVEWLTSQLQEPIVERQQQLEAERAAKLQEIANALALVEQQAAQQQQQLEQQRGAYAQQQAQALEELDYARRTGDWQRAFEAAQTLSNLATAQEQLAQSMALNLMQYLSPTWAQEEATRRDIVETTGSVPNWPTTTPQALVPVRDYITSSYGEQYVGYDPSTGEIIIGNQRIPVSALSSDLYKGYFDPTTNRAYLPAYVIESLLRGY